METSISEPSVRETIPALPPHVRQEIERRVSAKRIDLPMLPHVATQILAGGLNDAAEVRQISDLLNRDQALVGHVLRVANSAAYSRGARIVSIQQALIRIGFVQLREIVVAVALHSRVFKVRGFEELIADLWRHSAVAGAYAKEISRNLRYNVEAAFLCGLLHDVGKPIVLSLVLDIRGDGPNPVTREMCLAALDPYHMPVGQVLAEQWALPEPVVESIARHHEFESARQHGQAVRITHLADRLSHLALSEGEDHALAADSLRQNPVCSALNLYPDDLEELLDKRDEMLQVAEAYRL